MKKKYNVNDVVVCIKKGGKIIYNKKYTITRITHGGFVQVDNIKHNYFNPDVYFKHINEVRTYNNRKT